MLSKYPNLTQELIEECKEHFDTIDEDKDGYIYDMDCVRGLFMSMGVDPTEKDVRALYFKVLNKEMDEDGKLYPEEFLKMMD